MKYNKRRSLFIRTFSVFVIIFFLVCLWGFLFSDLNVLTFIASLLQIILWCGFLYYQIVRYDSQKIVSQFGWPRIYFKDIKEVEFFAGDIVIKTKKRSISINTQIADKASLQKFVETLERETKFQLNLV
ncbi:hypothetical protein [Psychroflexus sp. MBR-150]